MLVFHQRQVTDASSNSVDEDIIEERTDALRKKLEKEEEADAASSSRKPNTKGLKSHQVHDLAAAKIEETEKLRRALGIRKDYEEGSHWKKQEERLRESVKEQKPEPKAAAHDDDGDERDKDRGRSRRDDDSSDYDSDSSRSYSD